jgi:hypothetical protein
MSKSRNRQLRERTKVAKKRVGVFTRLLQRHAAMNDNTPRTSVMGTEMNFMSVQDKASLLFALGDTTLNGRTVCVELINILQEKYTN